MGVAADLSPDAVSKAHYHGTMMRLVALLLLGIPLASSAGAAAQTHIHHCVSANGTPVFTDQPCSSMNAVPATRTNHPLATRRPTGPRACPRDRAALAQRVAAAFRSGNVNALAGLMLWRGYAQRGAVRDVRQLGKLMHWPFLGIAQAARPPPAASAASPMTALPPLVPPAPTRAPHPPPARSLTVQLDRPADPAVSFAITRLDGCLWLQP
jgi:hypothetical protein